MISEDDDELAEILNQRKKKLLKELAKGNIEKKNDSGIQSPLQIKVEEYLTESAVRYLNKKFDSSSKHKIEEALRFLIANGLVEPGLDVEALAYIARRVLGFDYKIYVEDEGEYREL